MLRQLVRREAHLFELRHAGHHVHAEHAITAQSAQVVIEDIAFLAAELQILRPHDRMRRGVVVGPLGPADQRDLLIPHVGALPVRLSRRILQRLE